MQASSDTVEGRAPTAAPGAFAEVDVILRDGRTLRLRPPTRADVPAVTEFFRALSPQSLYTRFHGTVAAEDALSERFVDPDFVERGALIGVTDDRVVALANWARLRDPLSAEAAFAVADELQGHGVGTRLLERLAALAGEAGIERFVAEVLPSNVSMLRVFAGAGLEVRREIAEGNVEIEFPIASTHEYVTAVDSRDHVAVVASLRSFFEPRSVAVVGASARRGTIGGELFRNVLAGEFAGAAYPVNRNAEPVGGVRAYASVEEIPDDLDLVVICVPGEHVLPAAESALNAGVRALCVISAGFAEHGAEGRARQEQLLALVRAHGARLLGPNCLGIASAAARLNATFAAKPIPPGNIGFSSQSGALGLALLEAAAAPRPRALRVRVDRQQGRRLVERPARVVGGGRGDRRRPALPRVVRQPAQVRAARAPGRAPQADPRAEERQRRAQAVAPPARTRPRSPGRTPRSTRSSTRPA